MKNHTGIYLRLHETNDAKILERLRTVTNKNGYIKALINNDASVYKKFKKGEGNG